MTFDGKRSNKSYSVCSAKHMEIIPVVLFENTYYGYSAVFDIVLYIIHDGHKSKRKS